MDVAKHWAWLQFNQTTNQEKESENITKQMQVFGATEQDIEQFINREKAKQKAIETDCLIWTENIISVEIFMLLATQWHIQPMTGHRISLNWQSVEIAIRNKVECVEQTAKEQAEIFSHIQSMEQAAIIILREEQSKQADE